MVGVKGGKPHQAVYPVLRFEVAHGVVTAYAERGALDARLLAGGAIQHLSAVASPFRPAQVHPEQHLRPVLRLGTASPGVNG